MGACRKWREVTYRLDEGRKKREKNRATWCELVGRGGADLGASKKERDGVWGSWREKKKKKHGDAVQARG